MTTFGDVELLGADTIHESVALSRSIDWPSIKGHWHEFHRAGTVFGIRSGPRSFASPGVPAPLCAQGVLVDYGTLGYVGSMNVGPNWQRQGLASRLLARVIEESERREIPILGLVATEVGEPLYRREGFDEIGRVLTMCGTGRCGASTNAESAARVLSLEGNAGKHEAIEAFDRKLLGCGRARLVRARAELATACAVVQERGEIAGYGFADEQEVGYRVSPIVALHSEAAMAVLDCLVSVGQGPIRIDVPEAQTDFLRFARSLGFTEVVSKPEMVRGKGAFSLASSYRFALASLGLG